MPDVNEPAPLFLDNLNAAQRSWLTTHWAATTLSNRISEAASATATPRPDVMAGLLADTKRLAAKAEAVGIGGMGASGSILPTWRQVVDLLEQWNRVQSSADRVAAANAARIAAMDAAIYTRRGLLAGEKWPE